jgi:hypothetical protein
MSLALLKQADNDGVTLTPTATGGITIRTPNQHALTRWRELVRDNKATLLEALEEERAHALTEREAFIHHGGGVPLLWAKGYARLCLMPAPSNYRKKDWEHLINNTGLFLDRWGKAAAAAGWSEYDLFAAHKAAPLARYDQMGLLPLLGTNKVTAVSAEGASLLSDHGAIQQWRRRPYDPATAIMVWELV